MVIEDAGHIRLRHRRLALALAAGAGTLAAAAAIWGYGWAYGPAKDVPDVLFLVGLAHLGGAWLRSRRRRADFQLRPAVVLPDGVRPAFVAGRSWGRAAFELVGLASLGAAALLPGGARIAAGDWWWQGLAHTAGGAALAIIMAHEAYKFVRYPGLALTAEGIVEGRQLVRWDEITSITRDEEHITLRRKGSKEVSLDGRHWQVSTDRIQQVIEHFRVNPHDRPSSF
ncbi:hypothetical protein WEI85_08020 [Actinomycetes bacterium KLBMP 9797]